MVSELKSEVEQRITQVVRETVRAEAIYLFGSRSRGDARADSDFDILVVVAGQFERGELIRFATLCRQRLAAHDIDADVLVKSNTEVRDYADKLGSVVYEALKSGVAL